ncbi:hypothetical protein ACVWXN_007264 [Bradyrhizobium sp. i1.4.4]
MDDYIQLKRSSPTNADQGIRKLAISKVFQQTAKAQWLLFAAEWLKQAETAEALAKRETAEIVSAK